MLRGKGLQCQKYSGPYLYSISLCNLQGFFALVEEGSKYPLVSETSFLIRPGHVSHVAIGATQVVATDGIRGVDPLIRNCYFPDEKEMRLHRWSVMGHSHMTSAGLKEGVGPRDIGEGG